MKRKYSSREYLGSLVKGSPFEQKKNVHEVRAKVIRKAEKKLNLIGPWKAGILEKDLEMTVGT